MSLRQYLNFVRKHWALLAIGAVVGVLVGTYTVATSERSYRAGVAFFVSSVGEGTVSSANVGDQFALRRVNSYLALLRTDRLGQMIVDDTGIDLAPSRVRSRISGTADLNTVLLTARVADADRDQALLIAESLARQFPELVATVERPVTGESTVRLEVVSGPSVSVVPVRTKLILATRLAAGLLIAAALALVRELTDNRLHSIEEAAALSNAPVLGLVGYDRQAQSTPLVLKSDLRSVRAEEYRQIRTNLQFVDPEHRARVIVVTSAMPAEGKSVTAANIAIAMARSGQRVVIVDADLRKPTIGQRFDMEQSVGLTDVLRGRVRRDEVIQWWGDREVAVLPSGVPPPNPSELLGTVATRRLVGELRAQFDMVIIDTPPLVPVTDAAVVSTLADGVLLVVRPGKLTAPQFERAVAQLERVQANVLGLVGSMTTGRIGESYGYYGTDVPVDDDADADEPTGRLRPSTGTGSGFVLDDVLTDVESQMSRGQGSGGDRSA